MLKRWDDANAYRRTEIVGVRSPLPFFLVNVCVLLHEKSVLLKAYVAKDTMDASGNSPIS